MTRDQGAGNWNRNRVGGFHFEKKKERAMMDANSPDPADGEDAREAADMGEKPDLGHRADALIEALDGTDSGSDTRAGSLRGGSASGSDNDPDSEVINAQLAEEGRASADPESPSDVGPDAVEGSGKDFETARADPAEGARGAD